ncbi:MAG: SLC13 family permease [Deltaproteobacteria bacterium]|nr:MAG: SLC13 family permease [Deltaproteobacteria bacterium]
MARVTLGLAALGTVLLTPDSFEVLATLTVVALVVAGLALRLAGPDLVLLAGLTVLLALRVVAPDAAFSGFSNPAVLSLAGLLVVAAGVRETGGLDALAHRLLGTPRSLAGAQLRMMLPVAFLSAFVGNTAVVAMGVPIVQDWARRLGRSASKLLLPLSYAAILGGMCTLIGTSTNLVVYGLWVQRDPAASVGLFDLAAVGVPALVVGVLYVLVASRALLPERRAGTARVLDNPREYSVVMRVEAGSPVVGRSVEAAGLRHLEALYLAEIERGGTLLPAVGPKTRIQAGDHLRFVGVVERVAELRRIPGLVLAEEQAAKLREPSPERCLVEAVLSGTSPLVGKGVRESRFRTRYNAAILAVHRHGRRVEGKIGDIVLEAGDALLLEAHPSFTDAYRSHGDFLLVREVENSQPPRREKAWMALAILGGLVALVALSILPLLTATLLACGAMLLTGCLTGTEARRALDLRLLLAVGAAFGLGEAVQQSGLAPYLAQRLLDAGAGQAPVVLLLALYAVTALLTELVTNAAAAALVFPVAWRLAENAGLPVEPFLFVLMIAASASFATPIGYQTNLMVYDPGAYRFSDYLRFGLPLQILVAAVVVAAARLLWL